MAAQADKVQQEPVQLEVTQLLEQLAARAAQVMPAD
jgi:hypothetical protein